MLTTGNIIKLYKSIIILFLLLLISGCVSNSTTKGALAGAIYGVAKGDYKTAAKGAAIGGLLGGINDLMRQNYNKYNNQRIMSVKCNQQRHAGGLSGGVFNVNMGQTSGTFNIHYTTYKVSDAIQVIYEGRIIKDIGCVSTGGTKKSPIWKSKKIKYRGRSDKLVVRVGGNCSRRSDGSSTEWAFTVGCPRKNKCDFSKAKRCVGASGQGCKGNGLTTKDKQSCLIRLLVTPGSRNHDNCCAKYPKGHMCWGKGPSSQRSQYRKEWDQAKHDVLWYPYSKHHFCWYGPYIRGGQRPSEHPRWCE